MRILVTGAGGMLGRAATRQLAERGHHVAAFDRQELDVVDAAQVHDVVGRSRPDAIWHCAAFTNVDAAESDAAGARRVNAGGAANVAAAARATGARMLYVSTDYVFDGARREPYDVAALPNPLGVYGRTKLEGEHAARGVDDHLIVRTSWVYGRGGRTFGSRLLERARAGDNIRAITDQRSAPTWVNDAADMMIGLLENLAAPGIYHACNAGDASWYEFALAAVRTAGIDAHVEPVSLADLALPAPRPVYSVLDVAATANVVGTVRRWDDALTAAIDDGI